jgi:uncharacterized membrane-anchored protein
MNFRSLVLAVALLFAAAAAALAQQSQQSSDEDKFLAEIGKLSWQAGPSDGKIAGKASLAVPKGYYFLPAADTSKFLTLMKNLPRQDSYTLAPEKMEWFSIFDFEAIGYVRDDEKLDPDAILQSLKEGNAAGNEERKKRGLPSIYLEGWFVTPHYDLQTKRLEWATKLRNAGGEIVVNYKIRILSRSGVMNAILVTGPTTLDNDIRAFKTALTGFSFEPGERYSEYRTGDKIAEYGLTGLIVGGAAAAAAKTGLFKVIGKFAIVIFAGLGALGMGVLRWLMSFRRKAT